MRFERRPFLGTCALVFILTITGARIAQADTTPLSITAASFFLAEGETPPIADASQWQQRRLPDTWNEGQPGIGGNGWYRVDLNKNPLDGKCFTS
ncbi:MAG: hypothetical protein FJ147_18385 [Deltaproteobacteria bacterium]|nr:hypothetical protein [Deltaproteobacteria bacterium]